MLKSEAVSYRLSIGEVGNLASEARDRDPGGGRSYSEARDRDQEVAPTAKHLTRKIETAGKLNGSALKCRA